MTSPVPLSSEGDWNIYSASLVNGAWIVTPGRPHGVRRLVYRMCCALATITGLRMGCWLLNDSPLNRLVDWCLRRPPSPDQGPV